MIFQKKYHPVTSILARTEALVLTRRPDTFVIVQSIGRGNIVMVSFMTPEILYDGS
jgi:hypothetical protein